MLIIGSDECGTGSAFGQIVVGCIIAKPDWSIIGLNDSKKLSLAQREKVEKDIYSEQEKGNILIHIFESSHTEIDNLGMGVALKNLYNKVLGLDNSEITQIIIDGNMNFNNSKVLSEPKADGKYHVVMAASIVAKCYRDRIIKDIAKQYPEYGLEKHVGYLTKQHKEAIKKYGLTPLHRKSYNIKL